MRNFTEAVYDYHENGVLWYEFFFVGNSFHRTDGPARIHYDTSGNKIVEQYFLNDFEHRIDGPSYIMYNPVDGTIISEGYAILGKDLTKEQFYTPGFIDSIIIENS
jgi:hypothetical protein